ncbi:MAG: hypothetical protein AAGD07_19560 [Planctomycetota bacterium]
MKDVLRSRRFWIALLTVLFLVTDQFGLTLSGEHVHAFVALVAQQIDTPDEIDAYRLVRSEANSVHAVGYAWIIRRLSDGYRPDLIRVDGGKVAIWTGPPGTYEIDLICQVDGGLTQAHARVVIREKDLHPDPGPQPPEPNPPPQPGPKPDLIFVPTDEFNDLGRQVLSLLHANAHETFPALELARRYRSTALRLAGKQTPILPTISAATNALKKGHEDTLRGEDAAIWMACRIEIAKVWEEFEREMDRAMAARFISAIGNGLEAFADG